MGSVVMGVDVEALAADVVRSFSAPGETPPRLVLELAES
jgi:hypothetical protein